jgi:hypothetical protein
MSRFAGFDHEFVATLVAASLALAATRASAADAAPRPVRIDYEAPTSCPDARAFEAQLRARSARIVIARDARATVRVRIASRSTRFTGDVALLDNGSGETTRHVEGQCPDVVAALSLIAAVALDPMASTASDPLAAPPPAAPATASAPAAADKPTVASEEAKASSVSAQIAERQAREARERDVERENQVPGMSVHHGWRWSIGGGLAVTGGVTPELTVSIPVFVDLARWSRGPSSQVWSPSFRLRFERTSADIEASGADFTWTAGSLDVCPLALAAHPFRAWACARGEAGVLAATGDKSPPRAVTRPWVSAAALARVRWVIVGALFIEVEGGGYTPIVRDRFFVEPDETVHRSPAFSAMGAASLGASFW